MSISLLPQTPLAPTTAQQQIYKQNKIVQLTTGLLNAPSVLYAAWKKGFLDIWQNPDGFTPQEVLSGLAVTVGKNTVMLGGLGTNAGHLFALSTAQVTAFEVAAQTDTAFAADLAATLAIAEPFSVNSDGSITVTPPAA